MSRRLKRIIKSFDFTPDKRSQMTFSASTIRLDDQKGVRLTLVSGEFSTAANLNAKTWTTRPRSAKRWIGFMADVKHYKDTLGDVVTAVQYRLGTGADEMHWDGFDWVVSGASDWNTEAEVANNIHLFPVGDQTIQVILNLSTTDANYSPEVKRIKLLYESDLEEIEDYIWRTCLNEFKENVRPIGEHAIELAVASDAIDLDAFPIETPYNIVSIDSVYNVTDDPDKLVDLFVSYDSGSRVITLDDPISAGKVAFIRFTYEPEVAVTTSQDYTEHEKVPEILIEQIVKENDLGIVGSDYVINKATGSGWKVPTRQADIDCSCQFIADKAKDYARMSDAIRRYFRQNDLITSRGTDEKFRLVFLGEQEQSLALTQVELHSGRFRFRIVKAVFFDNDAVPVYGTMNFDLTLLKQ